MNDHNIHIDDLVNKSEELKDFAKPFHENGKLLNTNIFFNRCKDSFAYLAAAGVACTIAVKALERLGTSFIQLSSFQGSAFITGGLAFAAFEIGFHASDCLFGDKHAKVSYNPLNVLCGGLSTAAFAYLASVHIVTALAFAALGVGVKFFIDRGISRIFQFVSSFLSSPSSPRNIPVRKDNYKTPTPFLKTISWIFSCASAAGLLYETFTKPVAWLSVGYRSAVYGGMIGVITALAIQVLSSRILKDNTQNKVFGYLAGITVSCLVSPLSIPVNLFMLALAIGAKHVTDPANKF